ncbi:MAG: hypothetical protein OXH64_05225, partial [Rhodospirillaceae bacterium]|nr:hypothetical protein [Rhodospirillaceae bacterium]
MTGGQADPCRPFVHLMFFIAPVNPQATQGDEARNCAPADDDRLGRRRRPARAPAARVAVGIAGD